MAVDRVKEANKALAELHVKLARDIQDYIDKGNFNLAAAVGILEGLKINVIEAGKMATWDKTKLDIRGQDDQDEPDELLQHEDTISVITGLHNGKPAVFTWHPGAVLGTVQQGITKGTAVKLHNG